MNKKQISIVIILIVGITTPLITLIGVFIYVNSEEDYYRGIEVSSGLGILTEPIEILNPKGFNVLYNDRYEPVSYNNRSNIIINYRTAENVIATDYILDGLPPQPIPNNNTIPKPGVGNHSLVLLGINGTGGSCNSTTVYFYISNYPRGILGAAPMVYDKTNLSSVSTVAFAGLEKGLKTIVPYSTQIFLEGPQRTLVDAYITNTPYVKNINLKFEIVQIYIPYMICRSEQWYNHSVYVKSSFSSGSITGTCAWGEIVKDGDAEVIYFETMLLHIFGSVTYWNGEIRKYDVIDVLEILFCNTYGITYKSNESILELPLIREVTYETGSDGQPNGFYDKMTSYGNIIGGWSKEREWIRSQGFEGQVFLGKYEHDEFSPTPVQFSIPIQGKSDDGLLPISIEHLFARTHEDPGDYNPNYRGYENTFSYNLYSN